MKTQRGGWRPLRHERVLADMLRRSYRGELSYRYNRAENLLRAAWRRSD